MAYSVAAYALVIGTLVAYAGWALSQRRQLMREAEQDDRDGSAG